MIAKAWKTDLRRVTCEQSPVWAQPATLSLKWQESASWPAGACM